MSYYETHKNSAHKYDLNAKLLKQIYFNENLSQKKTNIKKKEKEKSRENRRMAQIAQKYNEKWDEKNELRNSI